MLSDWENKFREHWPHHYRDVLDKVQSPLGMVVVSDTVNSSYACERPMVTLERSFRKPTTYKIVIRNPLNNSVFEEKAYLEEQVESAVEDFVKIIGGWTEKVN